MTGSEIRIATSRVIPRQGFIHGFPERVGGVSTGPRASLNLGHRWGDSPDHVAENRRRLAAHVGFDVDELVVTQHVHGVAVMRVGNRRSEPAEFDGLVCAREGAVLGAFAADCIPLVFAEPVARVCGAAHAGWRGTLAGIGREVVLAMTELGADPAELRVALGPSIGPCCFEVGAEVADAFRAALPGLAGLIVKGPRKDHVNLGVAMRAVLEQAGVVPEHIDSEPPCTRCDAERFFSYRRDGQDGGVHMGFIGLVA